MMWALDGDLFKPEILKAKNTKLRNENVIFKIQKLKSK